MSAALGNPLVRRHLRLTRPEAVTTTVGMLSVGAVLLSLVLGWGLSHFPARFYLEEITFLVAVPSFVGFGMFQYFAFARFFRSVVPAELSLTRLREDEIALGLYLPPTARGLLFQGVLWLFLPLYYQAFVELSWTGYALFVISFLCVYEWIARLVFLLLFHFSGLLLFFLVLATSLAGFAMVWGLSGVLSRLRDDIILTPIAVGVVGGFFFIVNAATWRPFFAGIGVLYRRKLVAMMEGDNRAPDREAAAPSYIDRE